MNKTVSIYARMLFRFTAFAVVCMSCSCGRVEEATKTHKRVRSGQSADVESTNFDSGSLKTSIRLRTVTQASGIEFSYSNGETSDLYTILETLGGGIGVIDYDADGVADIFLTGGGEIEGPGEINGRESCLYRNEAAWSFGRVTVSARLQNSETYTHGVSVTDYDHDGFEDLLVTGYERQHLFRNQGDGTFLDSTNEAGLSTSQWCTSAVFADVSGDGHPDLYVCHYVNWSFENNPVCHSGGSRIRDACSPRRFQPISDSLFVSAGDGTFAERSSQVGLSEKGKGLGVVIADLDLDDDLDVYVANDTVPNFLYRNQGGYLDEQGIASGSALNAMGTPDGSMGVSLGDFNADGRPDLWVTNFENESFALYRNEGRFQFLSVSQSSGIARVGSQYVGWGTAFNDLDLDGDEDLIISNGHVNRHPPRNNLRQLPILFENQDGKKFANVAKLTGDYLNSPHRGRGLALGDFDLDGDSDVAISHLNEPVELLENCSLEQGNWLQIRLIGTTSSRIPIGASVSVSSNESRKQTRQLYAGGSYLSSSERVLLFAVGDSERVDLTIHWPTGEEQALANVSVNQRVTVLEL